MAETGKTIARKGAREALIALRQICGDQNAKDGDRIAAARLLLEYGGAEKGAPREEGLRVTLEGVPPEYLA